MCYNSGGMKRFTWLLLFPLLLAAQSAEDMALKVEASLRSFQSLQADFEHIYYSASVSTPLKEKGKFYFKKPGLIKWEYTEPEKKIFLYENNLLQSYFPEDNQLLRQSLSDEEQGSEILIILAGKRRLLDHYSVELSPFPTSNPDSFQIKLVSKEGDSDSYILLEINKKNWLVQKAISFDWSGNKSEFQFSQIKINEELPGDIFELKVPPGVEIIEDIKK